MTLEQALQILLQTLVMRDGLSLREAQTPSRRGTCLTDAELADLGITQARLTAYVAFLTQFSNLMNNKAVTTTNGRASVDGIRNV